MDIFTQSSGLVSESDIIALSEGLSLQDGFLVDAANGARHGLDSRVERALVHLGQPTTVKRWVKQASGVGLRGIETVEILLFLNSIAGLSVHRGVRRSFTLRMRHRLRGGLVVVPARRFAGSWLGIAVAVWWAMRPVVFATSFLLVTAIGANVATRSFVVGHIGFVLALYTSTVLHELAHLAVAQRNGRTAFVIVRGHRIGVLHRRLSIRHELASAVRGPLVGSLAAFTMGAVLLVMHQHPYVILSVSVVGVFHWFSWLPGYGDGQTIKRLRRFRYATTS